MCLAWKDPVVADWWKPCGFAGAIMLHHRDAESVLQALDGYLLERRAT